MIVDFEVYKFKIVDLYVNSVITVDLNVYNHRNCRFVYLQYFQIVDCLGIHIDCAM